MIRRAAFVLAVASCALAADACGDPAPDRAAVASTDGGAPSSDAEADRHPLPPPVEFRIEEEPEAPCSATTKAAPKAVTTGGLVLAGLAAAGDRFAARAIEGDSVVWFDRDGTNASAPLSLGSDVRIAGSTKGTSTLFVDGTSGMLTLRRFDPLGAPLGPALPLGALRAGRAFTVARSTRAPDATLAVWVAPPSFLEARILDDAGGSSAPVRLEDGAEEAAFDDLSVVAATSSSTTDASEYLVVWSLRRIALSAYRVYAALVGRGGIVGLVRVVFPSDVRITLVKLVTHEGGATLLANRDGAPLVVPLDVLGRVSATAHLFTDARDPSFGGAQDLAVGNGRVAFVAAHASGAHALRVVRPDDGEPEGGWTCLDAPQPDALRVASLVADGVGWKVLLAAHDGSAILDVDLSGENPR